MRGILQLSLLGGLSLCLLAQGGLEAQDVELLGRLHGTRPPQGYYDLISRDPGAYHYQRALIRRGLGLRDLPPVRAEGQVMSTVLTPAFLGALTGGAERAPMAGDFSFPLILGLFSDSPEPQSIYSRDAVQREFFDGPQANPNAIGTVPDYYGEVSGGLVNLSGVTFDPVVSDGYWLMIAPLPPGAHEISFGATVYVPEWDYGFTVDVIYHITVE